MEDVYDHIPVIDDHPLTAGITILGNGSLTSRVAYLTTNGSGNGLKLWLGRT